MARHDDWARITLRMPPELHEQLIKAAGVRSLNSEIVERLEMSVRIAPAGQVLLARLTSDDIETIRRLVKEELAAAWKKPLKIRWSTGE